MLQERSCYLRVQEFNSTYSRMRSSLAKHIVQRLSSKRVRQIEICARGGSERARDLVCANVSGFEVYSTAVYIYKS